MRSVTSSHVSTATLAGLKLYPGQHDSGNLRTSLVGLLDYTVWSPWSIMYDRRRQFESNLWASLMFPLGIKRNCTTAYHPHSNGIVERFHQQLKTSLKVHLNDPNWREELLIIMLGICTSVEEDIKCSALNAAQTTLRLPGELFYHTNSTAVDHTMFLNRLRNTMHRQYLVPTKHHGKRPSYDPEA